MVVFNVPRKNAFQMRLAQHNHVVEAFSPGTAVRRGQPLDSQFEPGAIYVMERGYVDFKRLHHIQEASAFFVTRAKRNFRCRRLYSYPVDITTGLPSQRRFA